MGLGLLHVIVTKYILHIHYIYTLPSIALVTTSVMSKKYVTNTVESKQGILM